MRPYLAIIKDSFRRALASRVLYIMLVLITFFLLLVAPLGYKEKLTTRVFPSDLRSGERFIPQLVSQGSSKPESPEARIWSRLDKSLKKELQELLENKDKTDADPEQMQSARQTVQNLVGALDYLVNDVSFYEREMWAGVDQGEEAEALLARADDDLSEDEMKRMNRLWLDAAFSESISGNSPTTFQLSYGPLELEFIPGLAVDEESFQKGVKSTVPWVLDTFVLSIGLLVSILITAPIIPQTFEPGSLALQFSKPVSRSLLFLSKYLGGCAFTLLCVTYLFGGVWLVLGFRWGVWHHGIWLCIPIYVFVFMIYFSVTAISGVIWRNTIVAVMLTILFWFSCWLLDTVKGMWEGILKTNEFTAIVQSGDDVIAVNPTNVAYRWDNSGGDWQEVLLTDEQQHRRSFLGMSEPLPSITGPVYSKELDGAVALRSEGLYRQKVLIGRSEDGYDYAEGPAAPGRIQTLRSEPTGHVIGITFGGAVFRLESDKFVDARPLNPNGSGTQLPLALESPTPLTGRKLYAINPDSGGLIVYRQGRVKVFTPDGARVYQDGLARDLGIELDITATSIAFSGDTLLVALDDGEIMALDGTTLDKKESYRADVNSRPKSVAASPGGQWFAVNYHNGDLWLLDTESGEFAEADVPGQGDISTMSFSGPNDLLLCNRELRVLRYDLDAGDVSAEYFSPQGWGDHVYYKVTRPLYTVFPKPRGFYQTVTYLLVEEEEVGFGGQQEELHPWRPVWSGLAFVVVMLVLACIYIERQEY